MVAPSQLQAEREADLDMAALEEVEMAEPAELSAVRTKAGAALALLNTQKGKVLEELVARRKLIMLLAASVERQHEQVHRGPSPTLLLCLCASCETACAPRRRPSPTYRVGPLCSSGAPCSVSSLWSPAVLTLGWRTQPPGGNAGHSATSRGASGKHVGADGKHQRHGYGSALSSSGRADTSARHGLAARMDEWVTRMTREPHDSGRMAHFLPDTA